MLSGSRLPGVLATGVTRRRAACATSRGRGSRHLLRCSTPLPATDAGNQPSASAPTLGCFSPCCGHGRGGRPGCQRIARTDVNIYVQTMSRWVIKDQPTHRFDVNMINRSDVTWGRGICRVGGDRDPGDEVSHRGRVRQPDHRSVVGRPCRRGIPSVGGDESGRSPKADGTAGKISRTAGHASGPVRADHPAAMPLECGTRALVCFVVEVGEGSLVAAGGGSQASGRANKPGSGSMRMPRLTRRFSLERMPSVFFGRIGGSRAWQRSRARIGRTAWPAGRSPCRSTSSHRSSVRSLGTACGCSCHNPSEPRTPDRQRCPNVTPSSDDKTDGTPRPALLHPSSNGTQAAPPQLTCVFPSRKRQAGAVRLRRDEAGSLLGTSGGQISR
ncbi:hypothetical protein QFZ49_003190 [Streptomyces turgidiscabies]|uniref:Uncharacterized protein n=1 Tax=Streptomyces turgidiscabies TaxID=85558 RepID=A0ABU0RMP0_9ACTN|nr:hypothetical protein [Streptomyces turgidiscabies]